MKKIDLQFFIICSLAVLMALFFLGFVFSYTIPKVNFNSEISLDENLQILNQKENNITWKLNYFLKSTNSQKGTYQSLNKLNKNFLKKAIKDYNNWKIDYSPKGIEMNKVHGDSNVEKIVITWRQYKDNFFGNFLNQEKNKILYNKE